MKFFEKYFEENLSTNRIKIRLKHNIEINKTALSVLKHQFR